MPVPFSDQSQLYLCLSFQIPDETLSYTKVACLYANEYKDKKDTYDQCYVQFGIRELFKTGRMDCEPKSGDKL